MALLVYVVCTVPLDVLFVQYWKYDKVLLVYNCTVLQYDTGPLGLLSVLC